MRAMIAQRTSVTASWREAPALKSTDTATSVARRVIDYVEAHYTQPISLRDVARALSYSPCHLTHTFRETTGIPVTAWIIKRRILAAQRLLAQPNVSVAAAAEAVGFSDLCYFTRQFVRHVGLTPGRYRYAMSAVLPTPGEGGIRVSSRNGVRVEERAARKCENVFCMSRTRVRRSVDSSSHSSR